MKKKWIILICSLAVALVAAIFMTCYNGSREEAPAEAKKTAVEKTRPAGDPYKAPNVIRHKVMLKKLPRFKVRPEDTEAQGVVGEIGK